MGRAVAINLVLFARAFSAAKTTGVTYDLRGRRAPLPTGSLDSLDASEHGIRENRATSLGAGQIRVR
jgi:hypothetical protein